ncbi:hypothetical protein [Streptomyces sp. NPDC127084]|uniref:hypothetical protein n=1 Tax=Streptomyces sp. NPDC127084 TaxID=3347133 RepID=UPI00364C0C26
MTLPQPPLSGGSRREAVPFAFVADADRFRSNVAPPPRRRPSKGQLLGRTLIGLTVTSGLTGALLFGMPALQAPEKAPPSHAEQSGRSGGR